MTIHLARAYEHFVVKSALTALFAMRKCDRPKFIATLVEDGFLEFAAGSVIANGQTIDWYRLIKPEPASEIDADLDTIFRVAVNEEVNLKPVTQDGWDYKHQLRHRIPRQTFGSQDYSKRNELLPHAMDATIHYDSVRLPS